MYNQKKILVVIIKFYQYREKGILWKKIIVVRCFHRGRKIFVGFQMLVRSL